MERTDSIEVLNDESDLSSCALYNLSIEDSWTGINLNDVNQSIDQSSELGSIKVLSESNYSTDGITKSMLENEDEGVVNNPDFTNTNYPENPPPTDPPFDQIVSSISSYSELPDKQLEVQNAQTTQPFSSQTVLDHHHMVHIFGYAVSKPFVFVVLGILCAVFLGLVQIVYHHWVTVSILTEQVKNSNSRVEQEISALMELLKQKESDIQEITTKFERTKSELNELLNDFSVMNVQLDAKTTAYTKLNSEYETLKSKSKSLRNDLLRVGRQLHDREAAYNNMLSEHERVKDEMSALLAEIRRLKLAFEEVQYSSILIPGIKSLRKIMCKILKLCPHLENI